MDVYVEGSGVCEWVVGLYDGRCVVRVWKMRRGAESVFSLLFVF